MPYDQAHPKRRVARKAQDKREPILIPLQANCQLLMLTFWIYGSVYA
jgi:hypothetical protein